MAEKMRVHLLAKEIGVKSKAILDKCKAEGLEVKNHMSALTAGLEATIREWFSEGAHATTIEKTERVDLKRVRVRPKKKKASASHASSEESESGTSVAVAEAPAPSVSVPRDDEMESPAQEEPMADDGVIAPAEEPVQEADGPPAVAAEVAIPEAEVEPVPAPEPEENAAVAEIPPALEAPEAAPEPTRPAGPQNVPAPAQLKGPRVIRVESPDVLPRPAPRAPRRPPPDESPMEPVDLSTGRTPRRGRGVAIAAPADDKKTKGRANPRRDSQSSEALAGERMREWRERDLIERKERMEAASGRGLHARRAARRAVGGGTKPALVFPKGRVELTEPIVMRDFCKETGIGLARIMPKLIREHGITPNIATILPTELAELLALEFGVELEVIPAKTALDAIREEFENRERKNPRLRPPVVTFLGHVDHGKTSLLDAIRRTQVAKSESGGITQHIGAYRLDREGSSVTFLDTPGHEAFTAMRARGAQMTDVVVLVVAVDDGVMAQTIEAINHAKAAKVPIVVALNKVDLPGADLNRVYGQLAEHELVPQEWGGETDVIKTSATTGEGLDTLIEYLSTLSELMDLKADPDVPATGIVIEANMKAGVGPVARVLVMEGTLASGKIVVCGGGYGRIRSLVDYVGERIARADAGTPVEIAGLDVLPEAGDRFYVLKDLQQAKDIAQEVHEERRQKSLTQSQKPRSLEDLFKQRDAGEIPELNIIVRADAQGSIEVLRKTLGEIPSDKAKLNILHAATGGITEGDVVLAQASDAIIVGFHVVADPAAQRLAMELGVDVRLYRVIYNLTDEIRKALEGLLEPEKQEEFRGRAQVREVFRVSRVGTIAGCLVTDGAIVRSHHVRLIRGGLIIVPTEEDAQKGRHRSIDSLKRFKDDAREVRNGMECGIRVSGFDDVKTGDVIEAYEIIKIARKL